MIRGSRTGRRAVLVAASIATFAFGGTLLAQARRGDGAAVFGPFADTHAALGRASITDDAALNSILNSLRAGTVQFNFDVSALARDAGARLTFVRSVGAALPRIVGSDPFRAVYQRLREEAARTGSGDAPIDPSLSRPDQIAGLQADIGDAERQAADSSLSRSQRNAIRDRIDEMRTRLRTLQREAADPAVRERDRAAHEQAMTRYREQHEAALAALEADFPADSRVLVARRLRTFLDTCGDVAFNAPTTRGADGRTRFTRPEHEAKPALWKLCFRAGRRPLDEAKRIARSWLGALEREGIHP